MTYIVIKKIKIKNNNKDMKIIFFFRVVSDKIFFNDLIFNVEFLIWSVIITKNAQYNIVISNKILGFLISFLSTPHICINCKHRLFSSII